MSERKKELRRRRQRRAERLKLRKKDVRTTPKARPAAGASS